MKTIEDRGEEQIKSLGNGAEKTFLDTDQTSIVSLFSKDNLNEEPTYELNKIVEMENKLDRNDFIYKTGNKRIRIKRMIFKSLK